MRTVTITNTIYTYNELSDDAKQKVKDWYLNDPDRTYFFSDDVKYNLEYLFGKHHDMKIQYDLGYCQGDGFNIYGSVAVMEVINFIKERKLSGDNFERLYNVLTEEEMTTILLYAEDTDGIGLPNNRHYSYCMADYIDFASEWQDQLEWAIEEEYAAVDNIDMELIKKFEQLVKDIFNALCKMYEKWGYEFFYEISDAELSETCEANEWEFYEDGTIY